MSKKYFLSLKELKLKYKAWDSINEHTYETLIEVDKFIHSEYMSISMSMNERVKEELFEINFLTPTFLNSPAKNVSRGTFKKSILKDKKKLFLAVGIFAVAGVLLYKYKSYKR